MCRHQNSNTHLFQLKLHKQLTPHHIAPSETNNHLFRDTPIYILGLFRLLF